MNHCPVCRGRPHPYLAQLRSVYSSQPYDLLSCGECGHVFTSPAPAPGELARIYRDEYAYDVHELLEGEKTFRARRLASRLPVVGEGKWALELGSMHGNLLKELGERGYGCVGLELNDAAAAKCRERGLNVTSEPLEDFLARNERKFNLVVLSHTLEHFSDVQRLLAGLRDHLAPDGRLLVALPNSRSWLARVSGRFWGYWQVPVHLHHFSPASLRRLLHEAGFGELVQWTAGGDSLLLLSILANALGRKRADVKLGRAGAVCVKLFSRIARYWYFFGDDDLCVLASTRSGANP